MFKIDVNWDVSKLLVDPEWMFNDPILWVNDRLASSVLPPEEMMKSG
ncbi:MAG: hypothetical protein ACR2O8_01085 [Rhizobiaceae bacterium]